MNPRPVSRREMFRSLFGRSHQETKQEPAPTTASPEPVPLPQPPPASGELALILDRFCLAYQGSFCSVCAERCPVPGAITTKDGKPSIVPDLCTGCRVCHDVCPAPKKAVFFVSRKPRPGMIGKTVDETAPGSMLA
ncbi:4Fe-4S binding protein [Haloferula sp. BvORR071]|uniref:4Fe-4S binding protein n=1 Tax=Haloferula sp. BvORR071 TaxID=1396141 RepID=UPI000697CDEA|nr:4Fe-4S binding protein [Haloferula sp. BvORR071]